MSVDETDLIRRLHAVAERFDMPAVPPAEDVQRGHRRVRRNRATVAVAAAAVAAVVAAGGGLAAGALGGSDSTRPAPVEQPTSSPPSPTGPQSLERPLHAADFGRELDAILLEARGWTVDQGGHVPANYDYAFNGACAGDWGESAESGGDGGPPPPGRNGAGFGHLGFAAEARASDAAARFVENLESCTAAAWRTRPIAGTGAVLAWSTHAVTWILHSDRDVQVLQVRSIDGPPPRDVQVAVAEWMFDYNTWQDEN